MSDRRRVSTKRHRRKRCDDEGPPEPPATKDNPHGLKAAGHKRREQLKRRLDELQAETEQIAKELQVESADFSSMEPDREVLQHFETDPYTGNDDIPIDNPDPAKVYFWCQCAMPNQSQAARFVFFAKRRGWSEVKVTDTFNGHRVMQSIPVSAQGTYIVGDTVLMHMPRERYERMVRDRREYRESLAGTAHAGAQEFAERHGIAFHKDVNDPHVRDLYKKHQVDHLVKREFKQELEQGTVPGMPAPR